jgi:tetratricopeptide (TPR) repeat protein
MRNTASYNLFPDAPTERRMARARWLAREGRLRDAQAAYRAVLDRHPEFKDCWAEYFDLLRRQRRLADALRLADAATDRFGAGAFTSTLRGAALIELGRYTEALTALEQALEYDPYLAAAWHELGLAAYRLRDGNRALLALDRAFALEPHTATLRLRGRVLRDAGRYVAAEVSFEGAAEAAEHDEQRAGARREIAVTRRYALWAPRRPADLAPAEVWFAETGGVVLSSRPAAGPPDDHALVGAFAELARDRGWRFGQLVVTAPTRHPWRTLAAAIGAPAVPLEGFDPGAVPLLAARSPLRASPAWRRRADAIREDGAGLVFTLEHPDQPADAARADVVGVLTSGRARHASAPDPGRAVSQAQHPAARVAERRLPGGP